jgi:hypothetical protein
MHSTHVACIAIYALITATFSTPTPVYDSYRPNGRPDGADFEPTEQGTLLRLFKVRNLLVQLSV